MPVTATRTRVVSFAPEVAPVADKEQTGATTLEDFETLALAQAQESGHGVSEVEGMHAEAGSLQRVLQMVRALQADPTAHTRVQRMGKELIVTINLAISEN